MEKMPNKAKVIYQGKTALRGAILALDLRKELVDRGLSDSKLQNAA